MLEAYGELLALHDTHRASVGTETPDVLAPVSGFEHNPGPAIRLTADEREAVRQAGQLYTFIAECIVADGPTRAGDLAELAAAVHVIQHAVMAQGAARAYPAEFRLLGATVTADSRTASPPVSAEPPHDQDSPPPKPGRAD
jgi:hypothetical protein